MPPISDRATGLHLVDAIGFSYAASKIFPLRAAEAFPAGPVGFYKFLVLFLGLHYAIKGLFPGSILLRAVILW